MPGGRVDAGESAEEALAREFKEELGVAIQCKLLACTGENFFEYNNEPHHEIGMYFYADLPVNSHLLNKQRTHIGVEGSKQLEFRWFPVHELSGLDMRPSVLKHGFAAGKLPNHFLQRD